MSEFIDCKTELASASAASNDRKVGGGGDDDDENYEDGDDNLLSNMTVSGNFMSDMYEFGANQWKQIKDDKTSKSISMAIKKQGEMRFANGMPSAEDSASTPSAGALEQSSSSSKYRSGILYKHQREAIIAKLRVSLDGKTSNTGLSNVFPKYIADVVKSITISVQGEIQDVKKLISAKKNVPGVIREEGYNKCLDLVRSEFGKVGLSKTLPIKIYIKERQPDIDVNICSKGDNIDELVDLLDTDVVYLSYIMDGKKVITGSKTVSSIRDLMRDEKKKKGQYTLLDYVRADFGRLGLTTNFPLKQFDKRLPDVDVNDDNLIGFDGNRVVYFSYLPENTDKKVIVTSKTVSSIRELIVSEGHNSFLDLVRADFAKVGLSTTLPLKPFVEDEIDIDFNSDFSVELDYSKRLEEVKLEFGRLNRLFTSLSSSTTETCESEVSSSASSSSEFSSSSLLSSVSTDFWQNALSIKLFKKSYLDIDVNDDTLIELEDKDTVYLTQDQDAIDTTEREKKAIEDAKKVKVTGRGGRAATTSATASAAAPASAATASNSSNKAIVIERRFKNSIKMVEEDVKQMILPISGNIKFKEDWSQLSYMCLWAGRVLNFLHGLYLDKSGFVFEVDRKELLNCIISLQRAIAELESIAPDALVKDAKYLSKQLVEMAEKKRMNLTTVLMSEFHDLIEKCKFDEISPKSMRLYSEQAHVLDLIYSHMKADTKTKTVVGYRVPPSGGKTILSLAAASMLGRCFPRKKRLLYVCYNRLVRLAVANACEQTETPYWVASTRLTALERGLGLSQVVTSFTCRDNSYAARRARRAITKADKFGTIQKCWEQAEKDTVSFNHIVIADITSAIELLELYGEDFIVYLDEPTAGAENGIEKLNDRGDLVENKMQVMVAKLITLLPSLTIMLSATLPNLRTEFPKLLELYRTENIIMVETQRLPVGCVAIAPDGSQYLPHQIAGSVEEFKEAVRGLKNDSLMLRFYTPGPVHQMGNLIERIARETRPHAVVIPTEITYASTFPNIGSISHKRIRAYAQNILEFVANCGHEGFIENVYLRLKNTVINTEEMKPIVAEDFIEKYIQAEGRALAVTTSSSSTIKVRPGKGKGCCDCKFCAQFEKDIDIESESLQRLCQRALSKYEDLIPDVSKFIHRYECEVAEAKKQQEAFLKKGGEDAIEKANDVEIPDFIWPVKIANFSAMLSDVELKSMNPGIVGYLLSGLGKYDPSKMTDIEQTVVMREAGNGHLACLFSAPDIVYGTNMSLINVFIGSGYGFNATRNSLYQLIGRAGRTGRSNKARILFEDFHTMKRAMLPEADGQNFEARVMEWHLDQALKARK